jgi:hypothetical protein
MWHYQNYEQEPERDGRQEESLEMPQRCRGKERDETALQ